MIAQPTKACIRVHGAGQIGWRLTIVSDRDCRIWCSQIIQLEGCHGWANGRDTGLDRHITSTYTLDLRANEPAALLISPGILCEGTSVYRNTAAPPADGALLLSSGDGWPGFEAPWMMRLQPHQ